MKEYTLGDEIKLTKNEIKILDSSLDHAARLRKESNSIWEALYKKHPELIDYNLQYDRGNKCLLISNKKEKN